MRRTRGFTLVELIVVIIILSILAGLAGFTYAATQGTLTARSTGSELATVAQAEQEFAADYGSYSAYPSDLSGLLPRGISLTNGASVGPFSVSIALGTDGSLGLAVRNSTGATCTLSTVAPYVSSTGGTVANAGAVTITTTPVGGGCSGSAALPGGVTSVTPATVKY